MSKRKRIAISGMGRIGRSILKINLLNNDFDVAFCNDINPDIKNLVYLLNYDSTYGSSENRFSFIEQKISYNNHNFNYLYKNSLLEIEWDKYDVDILILSSGLEKNILEARQLIKDGLLKKVIVTHCSDKVDKEIILGVNDEDLSKDHSIISNSICDANALGHIIKWINDEYKIKSGSLTTLHPWLGYQNLLDSFSFSSSNPGIPWSDFALARSSVDNLIPKNTTALAAVENVIPSIKDKMIAFSYRVPTNIVSSSDITLNLETDVSLEGFNKFLVSRSAMSNYVTVNYESLVSKDYKGNSSSAIIDMQWIQKVDNTYKIVIWYDNEWGYSCRAIDLAKKFISL